jgi:hypothetical protein
MMVITDGALHRGSSKYPTLPAKTVSQAQHWMLWGAKQVPGQWVVVQASPGSRVWPTFREPEGEEE